MIETKGAPVVEPEAVVETEPDRPTREEFLAASARLTYIGAGPTAEGAADAFEAEERWAQDVIERAARYGIQVDEDEIAAEVAETLPAVVTDDQRALAERSRALAPVTTLPSPGEWEAMLAVTDKIARTEFVPKALRGKPEAVLAAIMYGRELGLAPMQSLQKVHMIDGRPGLSADLMLAKMRAGGIIILESESTAERAWIKARRADTGEVAEVEWTIEDARAAGLLGKDNWQKYRADMLWARAIGRLARRLASDLLAGMTYSSEEMADWDDDGFANVSRGTAPVAFDPSREAVKDAPTGGWKPIMDLLVYVDPSLDWQAILADACEQLYNVRSVQELTPEQHKAFGLRSANAAAELRSNMQGDFPPDDERIVEILAWAYDGHALDLPRKATSGPETTAETETADTSGEDTGAQEEASGAGVSDAAYPPIDETEELPDFGKEATS